jgi:hypothetical protein
LGDFGTLRVRDPPIFSPYKYRHSCMSTVRRTHRWATVVALAMALAMPSRSQAQLGGEGLPDLSGIADAISATTAPKPGAGKTFSSGLTVPSVSPGSAAKDIGRELREKAESASGAKQPALSQLEAQMPETLSKLEAELVKVGLAKRDFGVAVAYFFVTTYETATSTTVPTEASLAAGRTIATAVAKEWGKNYKALPAEQQEKLYERILIAPTLVHILADQFDKAGKTDEAKAMRDAAGATFRTMFGAPVTSVKIDASGKITGLGDGAAKGDGTRVSRRTSTRNKAPAPPGAADGLPDGKFPQRREAVHPLPDAVHHDDGGRPRRTRPLSGRHRV